MRTRCLYICDGCGERRDFDEPDAPPPSGWFFASRAALDFWRSSGNRYDAGPWSGSVTACSADCVTKAKEAVMRRADEAVARYKAKISAAVMEMPNKK